MVINAAESYEIGPIRSPSGLTHLPVGLESGYDPVLGFMDKGVTAADHIKGGKNIVASGISLCKYVLLGVGGKKLWPEYAVATDKVLSEINPDYIRIRTLTINKQMPLYDEVANWNFVRSNDEDIIREERIIVEDLNCSNLDKSFLLNWQSAGQKSTCHRKTAAASVQARLHRIL